MKLEIFCEECPKAAENFLSLCASGIYSNTKVVQTIKGFIVQFGDPTNTGKGGESVRGSDLGDEITDTLKHDKRGVLSIANTDPNTNRSQFLITCNKHTSLNGKYTVFGMVLSGAYTTLDATLSRIETTLVGKKNKSKIRILLKDITIHANPVADKTPR